MEQQEQWATVDLMGHAQTAGRITMENGLVRIDVPAGDTYRTNYYGMAAIYHIEIVSEQIARAYAHVTHEVIAYDAPIVTREQHQAVVSRFEREVGQLNTNLRELERRLTSVNALPAPAREKEPDQMGFPFDEDDDEDEEER